jgi:hypothetical protein
MENPALCGVFHFSARCWKMAVPLTIGRNYLEEARAAEARLRISRNDETMAKLVWRSR